MQKLTVEQFQEMVQGHWTHAQEVNHIETIDRPFYDLDDDGEPVEKTIPHSFGQGVMTSSLVGMDYTIVYTESYNYDEYDLESFVTGTEGQDDVWSFYGFEVIDEDGDTIEPRQVTYLVEMPSEFSEIDYDNLKESLQETTRLDCEAVPADEFQDISLNVDNAPDLAFFGRLVADVTSYSANRNDRWTELKLYKTQKGRFVCQEINRSCWVGQRTRFKAMVCDTEAEVIEYFGQGWLAKHLYDYCDINNTIRID